MIDSESFQFKAGWGKLFDGFDDFLFGFDVFRVDGVFLMVKYGDISIPCQF